MTDSAPMVKLVEAPEDTECVQYVGRRGSRGGGKFVFECLDERAPEELASWFHRHCQAIAWTLPRVY